MRRYKKANERTATQHSHMPPHLPSSATDSRTLVLRRVAIGCIGLVAWLVCLPLTLLAAEASESSGASEGRLVHMLQSRVDEMRERLSLRQAVTVSIVPENPRMVSVAPTPAEAAFHMSFEHAFLAGLNEDELSAVIAHELGHVWIFTHHPYLQTEQLANRIAMRVVSRSSLEKVYEKVWARDGTKGDLDRFLGN